MKGQVGEERGTLKDTLKKGAINMQLFLTVKILKNI